MFKNWSLKTKLMAAFCTTAGFLLVVGAIGTYSLNEVTDFYEHIVKSNFPDTVEIGNFRTEQKDVIIAISTLVGQHNSAEEVANQKASIEKAYKAFDESEKRYTDEFAEGEEKLWEEFKSDWTNFRKLTDKLVALSGTGVRADDEQRDRIFNTSYKESRTALLQGFDKLTKFQQESMQSWTDKAEASAKHGQVLSLLLVGIGFIGAVFVGLFIASTLAKQLSGIASSLSQSADSVAGSSKEVADAGNQLSSATTEQAAAVQQSVASIDQVSAMVAKNADNAKRSQEISGTSQDAATKGKEVVGTMIASIAEIDRSNADIMSQIEASNQQISEIVKVIAEIGNKTKVINDIVFQTKLLSFNASVEAARAGEHGKGFAVVAEEVGNLAQMSGNAAKEISGMLESSIQKVEGIVNETKTKVEKLVTVGKEKVQAGSETAKRCGEVLEDIVRNVSDVNQMIGEIATASHEQSQGVDQISKAMNQMDQVTQQNASGSHQVAQSAAQLSAQAQTLRGFVQNLMETVQGAGAKFTASAPITAASPTHENVVSIRAGSKPQKKKPVADQKLGDVLPARGLKKAAGSDLPAADDDRFEEV